MAAICESHTWPTRGKILLRMPLSAPATALLVLGWTNGHCTRVSDAKLDWRDCVWTLEEEGGMEWVPEQLAACASLRLFSKHPYFFLAPTGALYVREFCKFWINNDIDSFKIAFQEGGEVKMDCSHKIQNWNHFAKLKIQNPKSKITLQEEGEVEWVAGCNAGERRG